MSIRNTIIDNVVAACKLLKTSDDYAANVQSVSEYASNYATAYRDRTPLLMIADQGNETILVRDANNTRYSFDVILSIYVTGGTWATLRDSMNECLASLKQLINEEPDLGDNALDWQFVDSTGFQYNPNSNEGLLTVLTRVIYYVDNGTY